MSDIAINVIVRPLVVLGLFLLGASIAWGLKRIIPTGRVKTLLYSRTSDGFASVFLLGSFVLLFLVVWFTVGL